MSSDHPDSYRMMLCDPIESQQARLAAAVADCEEPGSDWKRRCTVIKDRMMGWVNEYGYGEYSVLAICSNPDDDDAIDCGPVPEAVPEHVRAAAFGALMAILARQALLDGLQSEANSFSYTLALAERHAQVTRDNPDARLDADRFNDDDVWSAALLRIHQMELGTDARRRGRQEQLERERPVRDKRDAELCEKGLKYKNDGQSDGEVVSSVIYECDRAAFWEKYPPYKDIGLSVTRVKTILRKNNVIAPK